MILWPHLDEQIKGGCSAAGETFANKSNTETASQHPSGTIDHNHDATGKESSPHSWHHNECVFIMLAAIFLMVGVNEKSHSIPQDFIL